jgi:hypothetical protein
MSTSEHIPFSDAPERKSPIAMIAPWLIAAIVIAAGAYLFLRVTEAPPVADGKITTLFAVEQQGAERVIVGVEISLRNAYEKEIIVRGVKAKIVTADGQEETDAAAAGSEHARYFQAIPQLKQSDAPPLAFDTKLAPGQQMTGLAMFTFPVNKDGFDKRKSLEVRLDFYGMKPVTLRP